MNRTTFLEILRKLDKEELKRFEAFLASPYFNTGRNVINLFQIIKKYSPEFNHMNLDKEELWKELFPEKEYNYGLMKNIIYDITKFAERFLEVEQLNSDDKQRMFNLLDKLTEKQLVNVFLSKYNAYEKNHIQSSKYYYDFYGDYLNLKLKRFNLEAFDIRLHSKSLSSEIAELMIYDFIARFSHNFNAIYIQENEMNEFAKNDLVKIFSRVLFTNTEFENYIEALSKDTGRNAKIGLVFVKLMKCYLNPESIEYFFEFKRTLLENDKYISPGGMRDLYACLSSALDNCHDVSGINKLQEFFDIAKLLVDKNIFLTDEGKVVPSLYMFSVKTSACLKNPEFIETLIKKFLPKIDASLRENFELYTNAYLHYSKNQYDKAQDYINKTSIDAFQMKFHLRNLQVLISFEKNDYEMFLYLMDTHKHFLSKNKSVSESYKESNMKFLNYINTIFKLRESRNKSEIAFTEKNLMDDAFVNKYWLLEKLRELR